MSSTVRTVLAKEWDRPELVTEPAPTPAADGSTVRVKVIASGVHAFVRARATGKHYSAQTLPHRVGADGVGSLDDGTKVYFTTLATGGGGLTDEIVVPKAQTYPLPSGADPHQVAALMNPAMASYMAILTRWAARANYDGSGWTALVLGATAASGRVAAAIARALGATKVIGTARDGSKIDKALFDVSISTGDCSSIDWSSAQSVDLVLDFVYGPVLQSLLAGLPAIRPITIINLGTLSGPTAELRADLLRSKNLTLVGSGPGAFNPKDLATNTAGMLKTLVESGVTNEVRIAKLADAEREWSAKVPSGTRLLFEP